MSNNSCTMKMFLSMMTALHEKQAVLVRGAHGIGKSQSIKQVAQELGLPLIDMRLAQTTEGDVIGLPELQATLYDENGEVVRRGQTNFLAPGWFVDAMQSPHCVFLDEINRATPEVMQAAFELVLDHRIMGKPVHPETRVYAAVNASADYQVNDMDPALLDRFLVVDLDPTHEEFCDWAKDNLDPVIVDFIRENPRHLEHTDQIEPGKIYPSRRSWQRLDMNLKSAGVIADPSSPLFTPIATGLVGIEASIALMDYIRNYDRNVTVDDILKSYEEKVKPRLETMSTEQLHGLNEKLLDWFSKRTRALGAAQARAVASYLNDLPSSEQFFAFWKELMKQHDNSSDNKKGPIVKLHPLVKERLLKVIVAQKKED